MEGARRFAFFSSVSRYRTHWAVFERVCALCGAEGLVVGRDSSSVPAVHREGWVDGVPANGALTMRDLPDGSRRARVIGVLRLLRHYRPEAVLLGPEPIDPDELAALAALVLRPGIRVVSFSMENRVTLPPGIRGRGIRYLWRRIDALAAASTSSLESYRAAGLPSATAAEALVCASESPPESTEPLALEIDPETSLVVAFVGRLVPEKGVRGLLDAIERVPRVALVVAGDGGLRDELADRVARSGLASRVRFLGLLPRRDVWSLLASADCVVLPSLTAPGWSEQFGYAIAEGMACGAAAIGSSSGAIPEVVGSGGIIVAEGDVEGLAAALRTLRDDPALLKHLQEEARRRYHESFTVDVTAQRLAALMRCEA